MNNRSNHREHRPLARAVEAGSLASFGLLFSPVQGVGVTVLLACAALALAATVGIVWGSRVRAARRWRAALEAYAARESARARGSRAAK